MLPMCGAGMMVVLIREEAVLGGMIFRVRDREGGCCGWVERMERV